jgi:hypothetical protein
MVRRCLKDSRRWRTSRPHQSNRGRGSRRCRRTCRPTRGECGLKSRRQFAGSWTPLPNWRGSREWKTFAHPRSRRGSTRTAPFGSPSNTFASAFLAFRTMSIVAFVTDSFAIRRILDHRGLSPQRVEKPPPTRDPQAEGLPGRPDLAASAAAQLAPWRARCRRIAAPHAQRALPMPRRFLCGPTGHRARQPPAGRRGSAARPAPR